MELISQINNTSVYRDPAPQSPLQGQGVMQPNAVYSKIMLRTIELDSADYKFDALAVERLMPSKNGANEIIFKRMLSLAAHTQPLVEGIPPASDQGRMVAFKATCNSYGRVMKFTDKVSWAVVDDLISEYTRQLSLKIPETKDILAQEALLAECQFFYSAEKEREGGATSDSDILITKSNGAVTHVKYLHPDCAPTIDEFRKIVLSMESAKVRPYIGTYFKVLASSAVLYDLITDKRVKEFMRYTNTGTAYSSDMVIDLFSLVFEKAKTIKTDNTYVNGDGNIVYIYHAPAVTKGSDAIGACNVLSIGKKLESIADTDTTSTFTVVPLTKSANGSYVTAEYTVTGKATLLTAVGSVIEAINPHYSFVVGEDCLYRIGVSGHTAPQFISKPIGSGGTEDPLNQKQSIGWKIDSLGYKVANPDAVVAYISMPTQYKIQVNARPDLKNQFTDYEYGFKSSDGRYYSPDQVMQTVVSGAVKYYVKGTSTEVSAIKLTELVQPINGGRLDSKGKNQVIHGNTPTTNFALKSNALVTFMTDQVVLHTDKKYYIKGLAGTASAEVVMLPVAYNADVIKADGTGTESRTVIETGTPDINKLDPNNK